MYGGNNDFITHCVVLDDLVLSDLQDSMYDRTISKMLVVIQWNRKKTKSCVSRVKFIHLRLLVVNLARALTT